MDHRGIVFPSIDEKSIAVSATEKLAACIFTAERCVMCMKKVQIYVSPNGDDTAAGTREAPLATLEGAKNYLRNLSRTAGATVTFLEGVYRFQKSVVFTDEDSGCDGMPVVYEGEGNVVFSGGAYICHSRLSEVTDTAMAERLPDPMKVKALDLTHLALDPDKTLGAIENTPRFYAGDQFYETARYPNREIWDGRNGPYLYSEKINVFEVEPGGRREHNRIQFHYDSEEVKPYLSKWTAEVLEDAYIYGFFWHQWSYGRYKPLLADAEKNILTAAFHRNGYDETGESKGKRRRQFITNLPEELDCAGEYYYDRKKGILYFIPYADFSDDTEMVISLLDVPAVKVEGAKNLLFKNIQFSHFVKQAILIDDADTVVFEGCEISHTADRPALIQNSYRCKFISCDVFDHATGGIRFNNCGNRYDLIHSGNAVINCVLHHVTQIWTVYYPAIECVNCCGVLIKGNTISKSHHAHIILTGVNDIWIEDNIIEEACLDTDDVGAVYWGRDPSDLGIVIRGNLFRNIGNLEADYMVSGVYIDDKATGAEIYNNVFYNTGEISHEKMDVLTNAYAIVQNNGQFLHAYNNIFIGTYVDQKPTILFTSMAYIIWMTWLYGMDESPWKDTWYKLLEETGFLTDTWREHYKNTVWAGMWDYVNEDIYNRIEEYRAAHADQDKQKTEAAISWLVFDEAWDHITEEGTYYPGTFMEFCKEYYGEELKESLDDFETRLPTDLNSAVGSHVFWKLIYHKLSIRTTSVFRNNLSIGMDRSYLNADGTLRGNVMNGFRQNYLPFTDKLTNGESMFVKYGEDFTLTPDGIKEVHKHIPEFHNFSVNNAGAKRGIGACRREAPHA